MEIWKDIPGYEKYQISNLGNFKKGKQKLKTHKNKRNGYIYIAVYNGKYKLFRVHKLVAQLFIANPENKPFVNHIDGNKENNKIENLEWCTQKENVKHAIEVLKVDYSKGIEKTHLKSQKKIIRSDGKTYNSIKEAKKDLNNEHAHIVEVCQGKLKKTCGYGWQYLKEAD